MEGLGHHGLFHNKDSMGAIMDHYDDIEEPN